MAGPVVVHGARTITAGSASPITDGGPALDKTGLRGTGVAARYGGAGQGDALILRVPAPA